MVVGCASTTTTLEGFTTGEIEVGSREMTVAFAETADQRSQGLREIETLPDGLDGMLFVFGEPRSATFGMRDTLIPLDIWWFDGEGVLVGSTEMTPCNEATCTDYGSPGDVAWALETPAGEVELVPGDTLTVVSES